MSEDLTTPTEQVVRSNPSNQTTTLKTAGGKTIKVRPLSVLEQMRLIRAMGAASAGNWVYQQFCESAAMVVAVNGIPQPFPQSERDIDAAVARLGDDVMHTVEAYRQEQVEAAFRAAQEAMMAKSMADRAREMMETTEDAEG